MHRCLIICAMLLAACGPKPAIQPYIPADLLQPVAGYIGPAPTTEGALIAAAIAEKRGREAANSKLAAISEILGPQ